MEFFTCCLPALLYNPGPHFEGTAYKDLADSISDYAERSKSRFTNSRFLRGLINHECAVVTFEELYQAVEKSPIDGLNLNDFCAKV